MTTPVQRQVAERQLKLFERQMLQAAEAMHEPDPQATVADAVSLAGHAAMGVACDPGLLHLLRINFFFDRGTLPHWVEASLLLSPLCHEEGADLYGMDAAMRDLLLQRLAAREGASRLRSVATLLWQYTERHTGWQDRSELRHAQKLTALNFLAPDKAGAWLEEADSQRGRGRLDATWFIAMRADLPRLPAGVRQDGDVVKVCDALLQLVPHWQRGSHAQLLRDSKVCNILVEPGGQARRWQVFQFLLYGTDTPPLLQEFEVDPLAGNGLFWPLVDGVQSSMPSSLNNDRISPAMAEETAVVLHGTVRLGIEEVATWCQPFDGHRLFLIDRSGANLNDLALRIDKRTGSQRSYRPTKLWPAHRFDAIELQVWLHAAGLQIGLLATGGDIEALVTDLLATSDNGTPERLFEQICLRTGVRWPDVMAEAASRFRPAPNKTQVLENLAADYERIRATQQSGGPRTAAMEAIVGQMRDVLEREPQQPLQYWQQSERAGYRLLAVVLLRLQPSSEACTWLGERLAEEQPFVGYHAALALREAATALPSEHLVAVNSAVEIAIQGLGAGRLESTDRGRVLKEAREKLKHPQPAGFTNLGHLPLLVWHGALLPWGASLLSASFSKNLKPLEPPFVVVFDQAMERERDLPLFGTLVSTRFRKNQRGELRILGDRRVRVMSFDERTDGQPTVSVEFEEVREDESSDEPYWDRVDRAFQALSRMEPLVMPPLGVQRSLFGSYELAQRVKHDDPATAYGVLAANTMQDRLQYLELLAIESIRRTLQAPVAMTAEQRTRFSEIMRRLHVKDVLQQMLTPFQTDRSHLLSLIKSLPDPSRSDTVLAAALAASPQDAELWAFAEPWLPLASKPRESEPEALKLWPNGSTLRIRFLGGSRTLRRQVIEAARPWFDHANLHYRVLGATSTEDADIRIGFDRNDSNWSYLGTDALIIKQDQATMNLGLLGDDAGDAGFRSAVLKEFGHALGLIQEHLNPNAKIDWAREVVVSQFSSEPNNWAMADIELQWFTPVNVADYREFDPRSVMLYRLQPDWLRSGKAIGGASVLSASDKRFIARLYPRSAA